MRRASLTDKDGTQNDIGSFKGFADFQYTA
jgi:hypothetical protein